MADRFPELSETDFTSLVDQKNSENIKKATKRYKYNLKCTNEIMLRRKQNYFCHYSTRARQWALGASRKQNKKINE